MTEPAITVVPFDLKSAAHDEYAALHAFTSRIHEELQPDDPPTPLEEAIAAWRGIMGVVNVRVWLARAADGRVVGRGQLVTANTPENQHLAEGTIQILPERRRQGLATGLLGRFVEGMRADRRRLLISNTIARAPSGEALMERLGGERGLETHVNQLKLEGLDRELLERWLAEGRSRGAEFELGLWEGPHPEADLPAIAELYEIMNTAPLGTLALEKQRVTPQMLRQMEAAIFARGTVRWTLVVRERSSGRFAGFTEAHWRPNAPQLLTQGNTGVFPEFRGRRLGRWLKAAMLEKVLRDRPEARFVRSSNADSNAAMLRINLELGFRPYLSRTIWQTEIEKIEAYLGGPGREG